MTVGSVKGMMLSATLFFIAISTTAFGQVSPLKVEIKSTQMVVKNLQNFEVSTRIENIGKEEMQIHLSQCSYSSLQWSADNSAVHVKQIICKKNAVSVIRLKPGEAYEKALPIQIEVPILGIPQHVTFRLGFSPWDEVGVPVTPSPPFHPGAPIWSNAITLNIGG
jgi:hypothetical protein